MGKVVVIKDALYVPNAVTLISVDQLTNMGMFVLFDKNAISLYRSMEKLKKDLPFIVSNRKIGQKLYTFEAKRLKNYNKNINIPQSFLSKITAECDADLLHQRYRHTTLHILKKKFPHLKSVDSLKPCLACISNQRRKGYKKKFTPNEGIPIPQNDTRGGKVEVDDSAFANFDSNDGDKRYGRYLMSDTKVLLNYPSVRGYKYMYVIVCRDTLIGEVLFGVEKNDFTAEMTHWMTAYHNRYNRYPAFWKFDSGTEFLNHKVLSYFQEKGVEFLSSNTKESNQNAHSERRIGVLWISVLKTLAQSGVPFHFW